MHPTTLLGRFARGPLLLDGPTGTELERRGHPTSLPLWTALAVREATDTLLAIHEDYVRAGADILTACTFRTSHHTLNKRGLGREAEALTREAVMLAREAGASVPIVARAPVLVAGSMGPLEDCYHPEATPDDATLARGHAQHAASLALCNVDLILIETVPTCREAIAAARAATETGLPVVVSLLVGAGATVLDATPLDRAVDELVRLPITALSVNCGSPAWCSFAIDALRRSGLVFGAYANSSTPDGSFGALPEALDVQVYEWAVRAWLDRGAGLIGGCCGTGPSHIAALRGLIDRRASEGR